MLTIITLVTFALFGLTAGSESSLFSHPLYFAPSGITSAALSLTTGPATTNVPVGYLLPGQSTVLLASPMTLSYSTMASHLDFDLASHSSGMMAITAPSHQDQFVGAVVGAVRLVSKVIIAYIVALMMAYAGLVFVLTHPVRLLLSSAGIAH